MHPISCPLGRAVALLLLAAGGRRPPARGGDPLLLRLRLEGLGW